jgi:D-arabinono-1,4-lactone oxidase
VNRPLLPEQMPYSRVGDDVVDLTGVHPFKPQHRSRPGDKAALVDAVRLGTKSGYEVRSLGSAWSLSHATVAADVIDTMFLRHHLSPPHGGRASLSADRLLPGSNVLGAFCAAHPAEVAHRAFVHVQAGIKLWMLLEDLKLCGLALPTMGAGGGQSLAGALSTATHGADFAVAPLVEWVRAVHLVGPMGQEWWITPKRSIFSGAEIRQMHDWPLSGEILADDDAFDAVRVAVGRMGVVYSMILEVVAPYSLLEVTHGGFEAGAFSGFSPIRVVSSPSERSPGQVFTNPDPNKYSWRSVRQQLENTGVQDGRLFGLLDAPITDFTSGWLRDELIGPTTSAIVNAFQAQRVAERAHDPLAEMAVDVTALSLADEFWSTLGPEDRAEIDAASFAILFGGQSLMSSFVSAGLLDFVARKMGFQQIARNLGGAVKPLRHLNILVSLATPDVCWVTRRWTIPSEGGSANLGKPDPDEISRVLHVDIEHELQGQPRDVLPVLNLVARRILEQVKAGIDAELTWWGMKLFPDAYITIDSLASVAYYFPTADFLRDEVPRIVNELTPAGGWSAEALFLLLYRLVTKSADVVRSKLTSPILGQVTGVIGSNAFVNPARVGDATDILDVHGYYLDYNTPGDSCEYLFDAAGDGYRLFADDVITLAKTQTVFGYMGIRFTPAASALLAMQRFELTASVEVATVRARTDPVFAEFWSNVHKAATKRLGIPHWGQEFTCGPDYIQSHYGADLTRWRQVLTDLSVDDPRVFSTEFTRGLDLEPSGTPGLLLCDSLTAFLEALEGAADS